LKLVAANSVHWYHTAALIEQLIKSGIPYSLQYVSIGPRRR